MKKLFAMLMLVVLPTAFSLNVMADERPDLKVHEHDFVKKVECKPGVWCRVRNQFEIDANFDHAPVTVIGVHLVGCPACREMEPYVEDAAVTYKGKAQFLKLDYYDNEALKDSLNVFVTPTYFIYKNNKLVETIPGAPFENFGAYIEPHLAK